MTMRRVVITGAGVVSPIGTGLPAFFAGLQAGAAGVDTIRSFDASTFATRIAGQVSGLDPGALALPEAEDEALRRDPKSLFGLIAAREALAAAFGDALPTVHYPSRQLGAFIATGLEIFHLEDLAGHVSADGVDGQALCAQLGEHAPGAWLQLPAHLGARCIARLAGSAGPLLVNVSACAAGTQAVGEAFRAIRDGLVDAAITGGYDSMVNPLGLGGFCLLGALSTDNEARGRASRPFDATRDGFVLGEGAAMLVLEERDAARQRGATVLAELLGYGSSLDAFRITDPDPEAKGAVAAMRAALADAGLPPAAVDYINAHGTGTPKGDRAETQAIKAVFGLQAAHVPVSSTKSQLGHLIGAAGAVELVACLFALSQGVLPATINLEVADPACDLDYVPLTPRRALVRTVLSNSFGFGGQNATIVLGAPRD